MNLIKKLGLIGLLTAGLSFAIPQQSYAEHKGKLEVRMDKGGYKINLENKESDKTHDIYFFKSSNGINIWFILRDDISGTSALGHMRGYIDRQDIISSPNLYHKTVPSGDYNETNKALWDIYLDILHQKEVHKEWQKKYGDKK